MRPRSISFRIKMAVASLALLLILLLTSTVFYGEYRWILEDEVRRMKALQEIAPQIDEASLRTLLRRSFPFWDLHSSGEPLELPQDSLSVPLTPPRGGGAGAALSPLPHEGGRFSFNSAMCW